MQQRPQSQVWRKGVPYADEADVRPLWHSMPINRETPPAEKPLDRMREKGWKPGRPGWKNGWLCCSLTGELLRRDAHVHRSFVPGHKTPPVWHGAPGWNWDLLEAPLTLHQSPFRSGTEGVGLAYTSMMMRFLQRALDEADEAASAAEQAELLKWWESDYAIERVRRGLALKLPDAAVLHVLEVVLTLHREMAEPAEIADWYGHRTAWVEDKAQWCWELAVAHRKSCECPTCQKRHASVRERQAISA